MTFSALSIKSFTKFARNRVLKDLSNKWQNYTHTYKDINPQRTKLILPTSTSTAMNRCYTRCRLGNTDVTHNYVFNKEPPPQCQFCNSSILTINHLLATCPSLSQLRSSIFHPAPVIELLTNPTVNNITKIYNFIKTLNLSNCI